MTKPVVPNTKPPLWASDPTYTIGPDTTFDNKVDSTSVAGQGHIAGKDFPTTAQEFNFQTNVMSAVDQFSFDSITAIASSDGAEDPRHLTTDDNGFTNHTGAVLFGTSTAVAPTLFVNTSQDGIETANIYSGGGPQSGLVVEAIAAQTTGFLYEARASNIGTAGGMLIECDNPEFPGLKIDIAEATGSGQGIGVDSTGGIGGQGTAGGTAVKAVGGADGGGGGGFAIEAFTGAPNATAISAFSNILGTSGNAAVRGSSFADADGGQFSANFGHGVVASVLDQAGAGAPLRIVPQTITPASSEVNEGSTWVLKDVAQSELRSQIQLGDATRKRWVPSFENEHVHLMRQWVDTGPGNSAGIGTPTVIQANFGFPAGDRPINASVPVIVTLTANALRGGGIASEDLATHGIWFKLRDNTAASDIFETLEYLPAVLEPPGAAGPGTSITWRDVQDVSNKQVCIRRHYVLPSSGTNDFTLSFYTNYPGFTIIASSVVLTIETAQ